MRMGKPEKVRRGQAAPIQVGADGKKPKHAARGSVVGKLSPDVISVYYAPEMKARAREILERYTEELVDYEDAGKAYEAARQQTEVEIDANGQQQQQLPPEPVPPKVPIYKSGYWLKEFEEMLNETSDHFQTKNGGWKSHARAARFERIMDERYGRLRPLLKQYPELETLVKSLQRKYATGYFSPIRQGKPPIPKSTAVIILFMMQRGNLRWEVTVLSVLFFLVGLQPWALVVLVAGLQTLMDNRKRRPLKPMKSHMPSTSPYYAVEENDEEQEDSRIDEGAEAEKERQHKIDILKQPVGTKISDEFDTASHPYDTVILGSGPSTLYTAALLSRTGRKVLVLSAKEDASGCCTLPGSDVPFDIESSNIARISRTQQTLAPALASSTDYQGGIRFAQLGSSADGHAFQILSVPGMGTESSSKESIPFILRADGMRSLVEDAALSLGDGWPGIDANDVGNSNSAAYIQACHSLNASASEFFMKKIIPDNASSLLKDGLYQGSTIRYASHFLDSGFQLNAHARSLMAAVGMPGENIKPSQASMGPHVTNVCAAMSGEGMHYPIGGPRALCHAFQKVIEENGGRVLTGVPIGRLIFEDVKDDSSKKELSPPRCIGIQLLDKREIKFDVKKFEKEGYKPAVVSMLGLITTFIRLLPNEIRDKYNTPVGLPALAERRPVLKILFSLEGSAKELDVTGADFHRLPNASLAQDRMDNTIGQVKLGTIGGDDNNDEAEVMAIEETDQATDSTDTDTNNKPKKSSKNKFEQGTSWMQISFPSAKDPSFESRHGKITTCVVTIEADDDFVTPFDTKPKLYTIQKGKGDTHGDYQWLMERVTNDLLATYPQLEGKITRSNMVGPLYRGLSHSPLRYAAKGVRAESPYPGLFSGGSDLTVGESFSASLVGGWLAANAVAGYTFLDIMYLDKNISTDIASYLEPADFVDEEDLAVDFTEENASKSPEKEELNDPPELGSEK
uniref:Uncharacterized protein n=1 Tax=Pseudo-nitzschia australis TaxID=44445 RepID=A0A7S4AMX2_9STRA|mmetsp:Transcript_13772/g.28908  ORF Transcript_13772/g.28908 Transcript_13772/m.28908 type:complete len:967 (+) Transcript_13772:147-3047(+)|eukprot:CAMPEP_0168193274 /NCGR_PEP_ID=MMETSP0139_2-20121125/18512_1 /TAXON_ID=44445 /ORGANISM="Pseudo-nitzschia australis, Strain 10249 10 AB" /LENGTH=966 /DNA_ID=CAMNT_0008116605 /DNA_START=86 /DNA_END=2986 /DNA_ORIENTATION=-